MVVVVLVVVAHIFVAEQQRQLEPARLRKHHPRLYYARLIQRMAQSYSLRLLKTRLFQMSVLPTLWRAGGFRPTYSRRSYPLTAVPKSRLPLLIPSWTERMCKLVTYLGSPLCPHSNRYRILLHPTLYRLARAKTGTGKTLAFLLPTIQRLFHRSPLASSSPAPRPVQRPTGTGPYMGVQVLVLSPTRELALQIESVARSLCTSSSRGVISVVGGTKFQTDQKRLQTRKADILVAVRPATRISCLDTPRKRSLIYNPINLLKSTADTWPPPRPPPEWRHRTAPFESSMPHPR